MDDFCVKISNTNPIAVVCGGTYNNKQISLIKDKIDTDRDIYEQMDISDFVKHYKLMSRSEMDDVIEQVKGNKPLINNIFKNKFSESCKNKFKIDSGQIMIKPTVKSERLFIAGQAGAGKSSLTSLYIREYSEMFPDRSVNLFTTHENEEAYKLHNVNEYILDDDFLDKDLNLNEFHNSLCIFDDCDNLQSKKISNVISAFNSDLISNGRKYDIHVLTLSHQLMDYKRTRLLLSEANRVVIFLGSGRYHIKRYLREYASLDKDQIKIILGLRSRWVCLGFTIPNYYISQHEVGLL